MEANCDVKNSQTKREDKFKQFVCETFHHKKNRVSLIDRIRNNENTEENVLYQAANVWKKRKSNKDKQRIIKNEPTTKKTELDEGIMLRRLRNYHKIMSTFKGKGRNSVTRQKPLEKLKRVAHQVLLLVRVYRSVRSFAIEKGGHGIICAEALQLKDAVVTDATKKDLLFDPNEYKSRYQFSIPGWARRTCALLPEQRNEGEVFNLVSLMKQLKSFRKYSAKMQMLLAKIVTYERFGRRRVVVRKGHIGRCFYLIFSGSVGVVIHGDEDSAFINEERPANVLRKGDAFGELALVRETNRSATVVCLENAEFLVVDKDDFFKLGVYRCSHEEMISRYTFMRSLEIFSSWPDENIKEVAEGGRLLELLCDKIVEANTTQSEFIYFVTKGQLDIIRLLELNKSTKTKSIASKSSREESAASRFSSKASNGLPMSWSDNSFRVYNSPNARLSPIKSQSSISLDTSPSSEKATCSEKSRSNRSCDKSEERLLSRRRATKKEVIRKQNDNLGTFIRVQSLEAGQGFGLNDVLNEEEQQLTRKRKLILVSAGCTLIRIQKSAIKNYADEETLSKIKQSKWTCPDDEYLNELYTRYNNWRCYREATVDNLCLFNKCIDKAMEERCRPIPFQPSTRREYNKSGGECNSPKSIHSVSSRRTLTISPHGNRPNSTVQMKATSPSILMK